MNKEEILDRFFKGEITQTELKGYLDRGEIDDSDIQSFSHLTSALKRKDTQEARQYLLGLDDLKDSNRNGSWKKILIAVVLVLIVGVSLFFLFLKKADVVEPKVDITKFAYLYPSEINSRSTDTINISESEVLSQSKTYYANSEYENYINYYEENKNILSLTEPPQLQYVSALIALKKYEKVLSAQNDIACNTTDCIQNLEWYTMISLIATNDMDKAKQMLDGIQKNANHIFNTDSKKLLKELNR